MKCYDCGKEFNSLESFHLNGDTVELCEKCGGSPHHEYAEPCPHCDLHVLIN